MATDAAVFVDFAVENHREDWLILPAELYDDYVDEWLPVNSAFHGGIKYHLIRLRGEPMLCGYAIVREYNPDFTEWHDDGCPVG